MSSLHKAGHTSGCTCNWLSSGVTWKLAHSSHVLWYNTAPWKFKETKRAFVVLFAEAKEKRRGVHFILENQFKGKSCTKTSYSFCITISDFTCPSHSKAESKCVTSRRDRVNKGVIAESGCA